MSSESAPSPKSNADDWRPTASWDILRRRAKMLRQLRAFFDERDFIEVETPTLSHDTVVDRHLEPLCVEVQLHTESGAREQGFLQTSPEFGMKRLLAAGADAIYQTTRAYRAGEFGPLHNIEFTMVEWYQIDDPPAIAMQRLSDLCDTMLNRGAAEIVTYRDAFETHVGIDPHQASLAEFQAAAKRLGDSTPHLDDIDSWRFYLLSHFVEPQLGVSQPAILCDYPASQAALAQLSCDDRGTQVAERFELYVDGVELANGYHELLDANELRRRNQAVNSQRIADQHMPLPEESRLNQAMDHGLPACSGVALGFDRLVMCAVGASSLAEVMAFPWPRA